MAPKMGPKTTPRRVQSESKIKTKNASLFYRSWTRLGPVLRRSWADLKAHLGSKMWSALSETAFREKSTFSKKWRLKTRFGSNLTRFRHPKRIQNEPKTSPKRIQNESKIESKIEANKLSKNGPPRAPWQAFAVDMRGPRCPLGG